MSNPFDDLKETETESTGSDDSESPTDDPETSDTESGTEVESTTDSGDTQTAHSAEASDESSTAATPDSSTSDKSAAGTSDESTTETSDESAADPPVNRREPDEFESDTAESVSPAETGPAFEYSAVKQKPFYARNETVAEFENAIRTTILPTLARAEVLDEETREIHDAVLRLANEQPERVAELVLEERRRSGEP